MSAPSSHPGLAGLDWLNFFVATLQTGFGPFIAVYLTTSKWTQAEIGLALGIGTAATVLSQVPAGLMVDAMRRKRAAVLVSTLLVAASAVLLAMWPQTLPVMAAQALHGFASCMLAPSIAAFTLILTGRHRFAYRIGRNARFAALGNAAGALLMGVCGTLLSSRAVFWLAAGLALPALIALAMAGRGAKARAAPPPPRKGSAWRLLTDRRLLAFAACVVLFHLCNAALLPLAAGALTRRAGDAANLLIAACIIGPQVVVALLSPAVAAAAERWGRRPVMLLGFGALPLRAVLFAGTGDPGLVVAAQLLDGVSAAAFGVLMPLIAADLTQRSGRFNLCLGLLGLAIGAGATLSTILAGWLATAASEHAAFLALAAVGVVAVFAVARGMPETGRPPGIGGSQASRQAAPRPSGGNTDANHSQRIAWAVARGRTLHRTWRAHPAQRCHARARQGRRVRPVVHRQGTRRLEPPRADPDLPGGPAARPHAGPADTHS